MLQVQRVRSFTGLGKAEPQDDQYMYGGEGVEKLAAKLVATQDALEAMCMEKESQKLFYEERLQCGPFNSGFNGMQNAQCPLHIKR